MVYLVFMIWMEEMLFHPFIMVLHHFSITGDRSPAEWQFPGRTEREGNVQFHKDLGLVSEVLRKDVVRNMEGDLGIGHVRYSTTGASVAENAQPLVLSYIKGTLALAHNGNLVNTRN